MKGSIPETSNLGKQTLFDYGSKFGVPKERQSKGKGPSSWDPIILSPSESRDGGRNCTIFFFAGHLGF